MSYPYGMSWKVSVRMAADAPQRASVTPLAPDNNGAMAAEFHPTYRTAPQADAELMQAGFRQLCGRSRNEKMGARARAICRRSG
ncbi:MAG: hypothetical protein QOH67_2883 [Hyphomicrobiales bacterium]|jgi:hypothetical protein|nr:hypothetical protein [Hyphomicrobiales bacterium]